MKEEKKGNIVIFDSSKLDESEEKMYECSGKIIIAWQNPLNLVKPDHETIPRKQKFLALFGIEVKAKTPKIPEYEEDLSRHITALQNFRSEIIDNHDKALIEKIESIFLKDVEVIYNYERIYKGKGSASPRYINYLLELQRKYDLRIKIMSCGCISDGEKKMYKDAGFFFQPISCPDTKSHVREYLYIEIKINMIEILVIDDQLGKDRAEMEMFAEKTSTYLLNSPYFTWQKFMNPLKIKQRTVACVDFSSGQSYNSKTKAMDNDYDKIINNITFQGRHLEKLALILLDGRFDSGELDGINLPKGRQGDEEFGAQVRARIKEDFPDLPVVMISSSPNDPPCLPKKNLNEKTLIECLLQYGRLTDDQRNYLQKLNGNP